MNQKRKIISVFLGLTLIVCLGFISGYYYKQQMAEEIYQEIETKAVTETVTETGNLISKEPGTEEIIQNEETSETKTTMTYPDVPVVDFSSLQNQNTDIYAWIKVPGTTIDYPVLQKKDSTDIYDDYYLNHTVEKKEGLPGSIYSEPCNSIDFDDNNTVLYGHNMKNGSMFGALHLFENDEFFDNNLYVYIVRPDKTMVYEIFAAITYSNMHIMRSFDFQDEVEYQSYLNSIYNNKNMNDHIRSDITVSPEDKILTLSTCIKGQKQNRYLVEAVLVDEYE